jgi:hypothetical protein
MNELSDVSPSGGIASPMKLGIHFPLLYYYEVISDISKLLMQYIGLLFTSVHTFSVKGTTLYSLNTDLTPFSPNTFYGQSSKLLPGTSEEILFFTLYQL